MKEGRDLSDYLNPVLVKEIRQSFHNRFILFTMAGLLTGQMIALVAVRYAWDASEMLNRPVGEFLLVPLILLLGACVYCVCGLAGELRFTAERRDRELDFTAITTLSPFRILSGKLAGVLVMALFLISLCLPFLVISYFLRGIEMRAMLLTILILFFLALAFSQLGILCGSAGKRGMAGVYAYLTMQFLPGMFVLMNVMRFRGFSGDFPLLLFSVFCILLILSALCFVLSVAIISPAASNRMMPIRIYLFLLYLLMPAAGWCLTLFDGGPADAVESMLVSFSAGGALLASLCATLGAFERDRAGVRVTRRCPDNPVGRFVYFLFSSGWGGGILLAWGMLLPIALLEYLPIASGPGGAVFLRCLIPGFYFLFYAEASISLRGLFPKKARPWILWLLVAILLALLPLLAHAVLGLGDDIGVLLCTSPFTVFAKAEQIPRYALYALFFAAVGLLPVFPALRRQYRAFRRGGEEKI